MGLTINGQPIAAIQVIVWVAVALICGGLAEGILGYSHVGFLTSLGVGLVGALVGTWLARLFHLPPLLVLTVGQTEVELVWSLVGALLLVILTSTFRYRRGYRYRYPNRYRN